MLDDSIVAAFVRKIKSADTGRKIRSIHLEEEALANGADAESGTSLDRVDVSRMLPVETAKEDPIESEAVTNDADAESGTSLGRFMQPVETAKEEDRLVATFVPEVHK